MAAPTEESPTEESVERLFGMFERVSTSMINLLGTVGRLDTLLTVESGTAPKANPALNAEGKRIQVRDFMLEDPKGESKRMGWALFK